MANREKLQEFITYRKTLENGRISKSREIFFNDSAVHEEFVMKELFANATDSSPKIDKIYMYCGSMSAFRDGMKEVVESVRNELSPDKDALNEEKDEWNDFNPYAKMIDRMTTFFEKGGRLEVIVDEDISTIRNEQIWRDTLSHYYNETKQLSISRLTSDYGIEHFIVSGNAYRSELSHEEKTALCCFNDPDYSSLLYSNFIFLQGEARPVII